MSAQPVIDDRRAVLFGLAAVLMWSTVATAFKLALRHLTRCSCCSWPTCVSILVLAGLLTARGGWRELRRTPRGELARAACLGALNPCLYYLMLFAAYDRLPAQVAQPLNYTWALTLTWLAIPLLGHRLRVRDLLAGLVCYAGVVVIVTGGRFGDFRYRPGRRGARAGQHGGLGALLAGQRAQRAGSGGDAAPELRGRHAASWRSLWCAATLPATARAAGRGVRRLLRDGRHLRALAAWRCGRPRPPRASPT